MLDDATTYNMYIIGSAVSIHEPDQWEDGVDSTAYRAASMASVLQYTYAKTRDTSRLLI